MKKALILCVLVACLSSCNLVPETPAHNYVVEAYVYSNEPVRNITIKAIVPLSEPEGTSEITENAQVVLIKNQTEYVLSFFPPDKKYRYTGTDLEILPNDILNLEVNVNGRVATASTLVPTVPQGINISKTQMIIPEIKSAADFITGNPLAGAELTVSWSNPNNELYYSVVEFRSNLLRPILPGDVQEVVDGILEDFAIITVPSTDTTLNVLGATLPSYGPYVVKIYRVNQEYADLYSSETQDSRDLNEPPSNIVNAQGIFSAFASDSIFFQVIKP